MKRPVPGWVGWLVMAGWIIGWDLHPDTETMSNRFAPVGTHGRKTYVVAWVYITGHLLRIIPERYDPLRRLDLLRWKTGGNT